MERLLLFLAILPTIIIGTLIYRSDKMDKEPTSLLVKLLASGVLAVFLTIVLTSILSIAFPFFANDNYQFLDHFSLAVYVFVGIALIEEFSKWIMTYLIAWRDRAFNHIYDAIVYSVFVSLGFATIENILYVFGNENFIAAVGTAITRMFFSVPGHAFFGVVMGYYLGLSKLTKVNKIADKSIMYLFCSVFVPTICHFLFDYLLMLESSISWLLFLAFTIALFGFGFSRVKRLSRIPTNLTNEKIIKFCSNCGEPVIGRYCSNCGHKHY